MGNKYSAEIISCMASNYHQPIAVLVERILTVQLPEQAGEKPRESEGDYAVSLIILLALEFEAWLSRARYFDADSKDKYALPWIKSLNDSALESIIQRLDEVYFVRDAIAHNHIWSYSQQRVEDKVHYSNFDLNLEWQSSENKFRRIVGGELPKLSLPRTKLLNLVVVPSFISRKDVVIVFETIRDALVILDRREHISLASQSPTVRFNGQLSFPFWSLIGQIQRSYVTSE